MRDNPRVDSRGRFKRSPSVATDVDDEKSWSGKYNEQDPLWMPASKPALGQTSISMRPRLIQTELKMFTLTDAVQIETQGRLPSRALINLSSE